ncbi:hypothetical protein ACSXEY_16310 (plasmid) [Clostridium perfringens]
MTNDTINNNTIVLSEKQEEKISKCKIIENVKKKRLKIQSLVTI